MKFSAYGFHRALRKSLGSKASSIVWNAINLTTEKQWGEFIDDIEAGEGSLEDRCRDLRLYGASALNLLMIGLEMLSSEEYEILERYCWVEEE